jgi:hypothetical protein
LTVDHVLEATKGAEALRKRGIVTPREEDRLRKSIIGKFKNKTIKSTVDPRKLARMGRAVERQEVTSREVHDVVMRIANDPQFTIDDAFAQSVEAADVDHTLDQLADRVQRRLDTYSKRREPMSAATRQSLLRLRAALDQVLRGSR